MTIAELHKLLDNYIADNHPKGGEHAFTLALQEDGQRRILNITTLIISNPEGLLFLCQDPTPPAVVAHIATRQG